MKKLITKDYVQQIQFYQLPKDFFKDPAYMGMRIESKVAYTLLLDLLPLSVKNNWVNEKGQIFVKLSRTKLMALLNIKGTQKIAQVMKELVDHKLIINKKIGLTKCNEIYMYPVEEEYLKKKSSKPQASPAKKTCPDSKSDQPMASLDLEAARSELGDLLKNQIHIEDLKQRYNPDFVDEIANSIGEMFTSTKTRIGSQDKPMSIVQDVVRKLKMYHIEHVIDQYMEVAAETVIFNPKKYLQTMIYNAVFEANARMVGHIRHHFGYGC